jgi:hypothetical protein
MKNVPSQKSKAMEKKMIERRSLLFPPRCEAFL